MVKFKELGFQSFEEYKNYFFETLLISNKTYDYFVDWDKVRKNVNKYINEISLINSLTKVSCENRERHFQKLLLDYPFVVNVIPLLLAERLKDEKINVFDVDLEQFLTFNFSQEKINEREVNKILEFCKKTGIMNLFEELKDIYDYLLGVEVGIDTNSRKNRSGEVFEKMCFQKIKKVIADKELMIYQHDPSFSVYPAEKSKGKTHDIVIYKNNKPVLIIECNFYNVTGSKPISIAESYIEMYRTAKRKGINFLWVTDGQGWLQMNEPLIRTMKQIEWVLNYSMLNMIDKILKD